MAPPAGLVTMIVNPSAGRGAGFRAYAESKTCRSLLESYGCTLRVVETTSRAGSAERLASEAASDSSLAIACGGDGTVHSVVQGLVGTSVAFGVVPLGTVNALASNLGVRFLDKPVGVAALQRLLTYEPVRIPLGEAIGERGTRSFAAMCGCGPDGALAESLAASSPWKRRLGRHSYPVRAAWLFATRRWPAFGVRYRLTALDEWHEVEAVAVLASRVPDLGGAFSSLTSNASMTSDRLHVQIVRPAGRLPGHVALAAWLGMPRFGLRNRLAMSLDVEELRCEALGSVNARAQADAEPMGGLPLTMRVRRDAIWMMMPGGLP